MSTCWSAPACSCRGRRPSSWPAGPWTRRQPWFRPARPTGRSWSTSAPGPGRSPRRWPTRCRRRACTRSSSTSPPTAGPPATWPAPPSTCGRATSPTRSTTSPVRWTSWSATRRTSRTRPGSPSPSRCATTTPSSRSTPPATGSTRSAWSSAGPPFCCGLGEWWVWSTRTPRGPARPRCSPAPAAGSRCATTSTWPGARDSCPPGGHDEPVTQEEPVSTTYPTSTDEERETAIEAAAQAVQRGALVVLPTDTVYGVGADAFDHDAVQALLDAKGRGREMPPPVLISSATTLDALATQVPPYVAALVRAFWPGPLTLVCQQQPSLTWDLGETKGTVAVRMPDHDVTLALLERTGPLAVSSANLSGLPAATEAAAAEGMLGESVEVVLDAGPSLQRRASTILDVRGPRPRLLRLGALSLPRLDSVLEQFDAASVSDVPEQPDLTDEADEPDLTDEADEPDLTDEADEPDLTDEADEPDLTDEADEPDL